MGIFHIALLMVRENRIERRIKTIMVTEVIYNLFEITNGICNRNTPRNVKMEILGNIVNGNIISDSNHKNIYIISGLLKTIFKRAKVLF